MLVLAKVIWGVCVYATEALILLDPATAVPPGSRIVTTAPLIPSSLPTLPVKNIVYTAV